MPARVLSFAAVGLHGREWCRRVGACILLLAAAASPSAQVAGNSDVALSIQTVFARRGPMLDVVENGDWLLVLGADAVALYRRDDAINGGAAVATAAIAHTRPWPRDLRGELKVDGMRYEAFLPGVVCRGTVQPLTASCADENGRWPLDLDNQGLVPNRNYFTTPEGFVFYGAASLSPDRLPSWVAVDATGTLAFLDDSRAVISHGDGADDVVRLKSPCGPSSYLATVGRTTPNTTRDDIRLHVVDGATVLTKATLTLSGEVTALWPKPDSRSAMVIVRQPGGIRYEAHQISVACAR